MDRTYLNKDLTSETFSLKPKTKSETKTKERIKKNEANEPENARTNGFG
jgi:hypothetical protein